ncbi:type II and III secretion system protein family protein [Moritella sp. Urea-trap-13]|uniref:type II and III secretion system protein family protein n=1 Tax=Moritella sp. Urea-trap-13 TaxID=2058327 RepID=UPI000C34AC7A|nr:type II and III secretion system protein family protein [Moritella sp. Urea-trap-13]PKH06286.1 pilus assembly protein CpaC [Moritella sp. Urea-trap-13]
MNINSHFDKPESWPKNNVWTLAILIFITNLFLASAVSAGGPTALDDDSVRIPIFKSKNLQMDQPIHRVSVGNPAIADILILRSSELYIVGKKLGTTNMMVWDKDDNLVDVQNLEVTHDLNSLRKRLHKYLPNEDIGVETSQGQLVVSGQATSLMKMSTAVEIAQGYATAANVDDSNSTVVNMMSVGGGQQVMLEVTVAEVSTEIGRNLDGNTVIGGFGSDGFGGIGTGTGNVPANILGGIDTNIFARYLTGDMLFSVALDVAKTKGLAKVLAEPNLTALSGQSAEFLSGGEYPVPVSTDDGVTIEYRDFGVGVSFVPTVLDSGKINLNLKVLVSEISNANSVAISAIETGSTTITPSLVKRSTATTVELGDGQTIVIGGLLSDNLRESVTKFPGLGDIPILGQLFTSQEYISGQTELVIMVTPRLVRPFNKEGMILPTDGFVPVSDMEFYLLGKMTQQDKDSATKNPNDNSGTPSSIVPSSGGTEQQYGHTLN